MIRTAHTLRANNHSVLKVSDVSGRVVIMIRVHIRRHRVVCGMTSCKSRRLDLCASFALSLSQYINVQLSL